MLHPEHSFAQHVRTLRSDSQSAGGAPEFHNVRAAVLAIRSALFDIEEAIAELERQLPAEALLRKDPARPFDRTDVPEVDPLIYRVEELRLGCEEILRRPLSGLERTIVMSWAGLERAGELVSVAEILDLTRHLMSRPTPEGTLPSTLKWCEATVQTLARASVSTLRGRGARNQAAELATLYKEMAERLESEEAGS
jgi:hypothetical protein